MGELLLEEQSAAALVLYLPAVEQPLRRADLQPAYFQSLQAHDLRVPGVPDHHRVPQDLRHDPLLPVPDRAHEAIVTYRLTIIREWQGIFLPYMRPGLFDFQKTNIPYIIGIDRNVYEIVSYLPPHTF